MSENDFESHVLSEDEVLSAEKLVPVSEAIRYRKRAQIAEKKTAELEGQIAENRKANEELTEKLNEVQFEQKLIGRLTAMGVHDIEAAVLMAKKRAADLEQADIDVILDQLRKEKSYLFKDSENLTVASMKTSGVKERAASGHRKLEGLAKRATTSGSRADVQEYLRERRRFL